MMISDDWFILRTAGRSTLSLAATLAEDGFDVWTPVRTLRIRIPRMNVKRDAKVPLLPSFVFARSHHLDDLLELSRMEEKPRRAKIVGDRFSRPAHRDFSVFHYLGQIPMVADRHLEPLRIKEVETVPKKSAPAFDRGSKVRVKTGAFEGLKGHVERCKSGYALVLFTDFKRPVNIPTFLLSEDDAIIAQNVARAA